MPVDGQTYHQVKGGNIPSPAHPMLDVLVINAPAEVKKPGAKPSLGQALSDVGFQAFSENGGGGAVYVIFDHKESGRRYARALMNAVAQPLFGTAPSLIPKGVSKEFLTGFHEAYTGQSFINAWAGVNAGLSLVGKPLGLSWRKGPGKGPPNGNGNAGGVNPSKVIINIKPTSVERVLPDNPKNSPTVTKNTNKIPPASTNNPPPGNNNIPNKKNKKFNDGFLNRSTPRNKKGMPVSSEEYFKVQTFKEMKEEFLSRYGSKYLPTDVGDSDKRVREFFLHDVLVHGLGEPNENKAFVHRINGRLIEFVFGEILAPGPSRKSVADINIFYKTIDEQVVTALSSPEFMKKLNNSLNDHYNLRPESIKSERPQYLLFYPIDIMVGHVFVMEREFVASPPADYKPRPLSAEDLFWMYQFYRGEVKRIAQMNNMTDAEFIKYILTQPLDKVEQLKISRPRSFPRWGATDPPPKH
ncbi:MAG: hypothetical protein ACK53K_06365 [Burkholderiales bacterium]